MSSHTVCTDKGLAGSESKFRRIIVAIVSLVCEDIQFIASCLYISALFSILIKGYNWVSIFISFLIDFTILTFSNFCKVISLMFLC